MSPTPHLPQHLLSMKSLNRQAIETILKRSRYYLNKCVNQNKITSTLKGKIVTNLFFEPSTRSRNAFEIAARRLGAIVLNPELSASSLVKGESLLDTVQTFNSLGTSLFVIRHSQDKLPEWISEQMSSSAVFINAGDGRHQHPTQGLIDLFTIQQNKGDWSSLRVAIIGDIAHSRVANSLMDGLITMGVAEIRLIGPSSLLPNNLSAENSKVYSSLDEGLTDCDVIVCLRLQKERMTHPNTLDPVAFQQEYGLTLKKLTRAKYDAIVMHPGPLNRDVEISSDVADSKQSVILQQVRNGVAVRMAVLDLFSH